ncbi:MAG: PIG-L family deacetylase [Flavobacteriaceae bacterium]
MHKIWVALCLFLFLFSNLFAQAPEKKTSSEIYHDIQKLNFLGSALFIAAHPDDENTRLISYLSNQVKARTAYLSMTRGDGGQNLIGPELKELLGVLRTQELLAARRVDGGEQLFTRAVDFGYSKHPDETFDIWEKEAVLGDVVRAIRQFQPDIVINRFDHRTPGRTHGHHTGSAILGVEAFDMAGRKDAFPDQLTNMAPWQPKRLFFNTSWWFYGSREKFEKADKSNLFSVDIGVYYPHLGLSNNEIAAMASSQHLCQGFGRLSQRGSTQEYLELLKGDRPSQENLFEGIDTSWSRLEDGKAIGNILEGVEREFDFANPSKHLPQLMEAYGLLQQVKSEHWKKIKSKELQDIIAAIGGLYLEASAQVPYSNPGNTVKLGIEVVSRSNAPVVVKGITVVEKNRLENPIQLKDNEKFESEWDVTIPTSMAYTSPYWLNEEGSLGLFKVNDPSLIGKPETPRALKAVFELDIHGQSISFARDIVHRYSEPDKGELYRPFEILPEATAHFSNDVLIFPSDEPITVPVTIVAHANEIKGEVLLCHDKGWKVENDGQSFSIEKKGDQKTLTFTLYPPKNESEAYISPIIKINGQEISKEMIQIAYDHVPIQTVLRNAEAKVVRLNIKRLGEHIGYIQGAGDKIPESLEQLGYQVHIIDPTAINGKNLSRFDAVVMGIRAYNVVDDLKFKQPFLLDYVKNGGTLLVQYNTASRWRAQFEGIAPYPLTISRDRVTNEEAPVKIIAQGHEVVNQPNKIYETDFDGWIQERGLYFPNKWDTHFTPILSMHDQGESAKKGSLLVAPYGKGHYIYTGLSFFRELPAGVPGAYKLFTNLLSLGKQEVPNNNPIKG